MGSVFGYICPMKKNAVSRTVRRLTAMGYLFHCSETFLFLRKFGVIKYRFGYFHSVSQINDTRIASQRYTYHEATIHVSWGDDTRIVKLLHK